MTNAVAVTIIASFAFTMVDMTFLGQSQKGIAIAEEGTVPARHFQPSDPFSAAGGEHAVIIDHEGQERVVRQQGSQRGHYVTAKGTVIMTRGNQVTIRLDEKDLVVQHAERVELSFSFDGEVIRVGNWRISSVKEDGTLEASPFNVQGIPSVGMDALVFINKQPEITRENQKRGEPVEKASLDHEETRLERACQGGDVDACADLANRYFHGTGGAIDYNRAVHFSKMACNGGAANGCNLLGVMYSTGKGVAVDKEHAAGLYRTACDGGLALGCRNLGFFYQNGVGVDQDFALAIELYRKACDARDAEGCTALGYMYGTGLGLELDYKSAVALYRRACDDGNAMGCKNLGAMYENGFGVDQDYQLAALYYEKGCDGGEALGCASFGWMLYFGRDVAANQAKGLAFIEKACTMGNLWSCEKLKEFGNPK